MGQSLIIFLCRSYISSLSLCNKLSKFYDLLDGQLTNRYDVICVTETWLTDSFPDSIIVNNCSYSVFRCDRLWHSGDGCAILIRSDLTMSPIVLPDSVHLSVTRVIAVDILTGGRYIAICCIYNPPSGDVHDVQNVCNAMNYISNKYYHVCILGDFNLPHFMPCMKRNAPFHVSLAPYITQSLHTLLNS